MAKKNHNTKQDIQIAELRQDICWIKKELQEVKKQVFNEIPHQIEQMKNQFFYGLIVAIATALILQIILKLF